MVLATSLTGHLQRCFSLVLGYAFSLFFPVLFRLTRLCAAGVTLGRTPLFSLSPKKTVEGFVGGFFSTVILGFFWATFSMQFDYMICPVKDLGTSAWSGLTCKPNPVFVWRSFELAKPAATFLSVLVSGVESRDGLVVDDRVDGPNSDEYPMGSIPIPRSRHGLLRISCRSIRGVLRFRLQARVQHQGLWTEYSRPWWNDRPDGLPVRNFFLSPLKRLEIVLMDKLTGS